MDHQNAKLKLLQAKTALAVAILRNRSEHDQSGLSTKDYVKLLQFNFESCFQANAEKIENLKAHLFQARLENFRLENQKAFESLDDQPQVSRSDQRRKELIDEVRSAEKQAPAPKVGAKLERINESLAENLDFLANVAKLKAVDKGVVKFSDNSKQFILDCLKRLLDQISLFFFVHDQSGGAELLFPADCLLHALQTFVNIYEIEWLYYLKSRLLPYLGQFINQLLTWQLSCPLESKSAADSALQLTTISQMLVVLSTSDYLMGHVLTSAVENLQTALEYIYEKASLHQHLSGQVTQQQNYSLLTGPAQVFELQASQPSQASSGSSYGSATTSSSLLQSQRKEIENLVDNCSHLVLCLETIVSQRRLANFTPISKHLRASLFKLLNTVFIKMTDNFPVFSIKLSKLLQLLAIDDNNNTF